MRMAGEWLRRAFVAASVAWAAAIPLAAAASSVARPGLPVYLFALAVYATGSVVCHQLPDRSFFLWGRQLPVCARCSGIYAAAAITVVVLGFMRARYPAPRSLFGTRASRRLAAVAALALNALTLAYEWTTGTVPSNMVRAAAGLAMGAVGAALLVYDVD